jgi:Domain of unknown function (DUF4266)
MVTPAVRYFSWFAVVILLGFGVLGDAGCVAVRAHQRGHLAKRAMVDDRATGEARFFEHERGSREGADGGTGQPGGGCGCN